jgi:hypothetical protein
MKKIILIMLGLSISLMADMVRDNTTMIVTDNVTHLEWRDDDAVISKSWTQAIVYCEGLDLNGTDWRLPNINELTSLIDYTFTNDNWKYPAFKNTADAAYWSSTTKAEVFASAWYLDFSATDNNRDKEKTASYNVRCVRAGQ